MTVLLALTLLVAEPLDAYAHLPPREHCYMMFDVAERYSRGRPEERWRADAWYLAWCLRHPEDRYRLVVTTVVLNPEVDPLESKMTGWWRHDHCELDQWIDLRAPRASGFDE